MRFENLSDRERQHMVEFERLAHERLRMVEVGCELLYEVATRFEHIVSSRMHYLPGELEQMKDALIASNRQSAQDGIELLGRIMCPVAVQRAIPPDDKRVIVYGPGSVVHGGDGWHVYDHDRTWNTFDKENDALVFSDEILGPLAASHSSIA